MENNKKSTGPQEKQYKPGENPAAQGVDKAPGEEAGKGEKVTGKDLKGKKVDADPSKESDKPAQ